MKLIIYIFALLFLPFLTFAQVNYIYPTPEPVNSGTGNQSSYIYPVQSGFDGYFFSSASAPSAGMVFQLPSPQNGTTTIRIRRDVGSTAVNCEFGIARQFVRGDLPSIVSGAQVVATSTDQVVELSTSNNNQMTAVGFWASHGDGNVSRFCNYTVLGVQHNGNDVYMINPSPVSIDFPESLNFQTDSINYSMGIMIMIMSITCGLVIFRRQ